nr:unnamed protein product [Digitaria exilis]
MAKPKACHLRPSRAAAAHASPRCSERSLPPRYPQTLAATTGS